MRRDSAGLFRADRADRSLGIRGPAVQRPKLRAPEQPPPPTTPSSRSPQHRHGDQVSAGIRPDVNRDADRRRYLILLSRQGKVVRLPGSFSSSFGL